MRKTLVCGPPCSGKNHYVAGHASPGDLIVDFDALITALGGAGNHDQPERLKRYAYKARDAVLAAYNDSPDVTAWIIYGAHKASDRTAYRKRGYQIVFLDVDRETCRERARAGRPPEWLTYIDNYFRKYEPDARVSLKASREW
jgi:hypothetical protein